MTQWLDNLHPLGHLFGARIVYEATTNNINEDWNMPSPISSNLETVRNNYPDYKPDINVTDIVEWNFSMTSSPIIMDLLERF